MTQAPKILSPALVDSAGWVYGLDTRGAHRWIPPKSRDVLMAARGQRPKGGVWPEGHGVVEIEDIPKPDPLPTVYVYRNPDGSAWASTLHPSRYITTPTDLICTYSADADDNATVVRHEVRP